MRVIAGEARGRRLHAPPGRGTRPILDQLKERLFSILGGRCDGLMVWDLFAGSGALGLEALSRGARRAVFVEKDRAARAVVARNVSELGFEDRGRVVGGDAFRPETWLRDDETPPDLVFADPPFPLVERAPDRVAAFLDDLVERLSPEGRLVFRTPSDHDWRRAPRCAGFADRRVHGANVLWIVSRSASPAD